MGLSFKLHHDHVHIVVEGFDKVVDKSYPLDTFKLLVTQFLKYYREGRTDISAQVQQVPLESTWQYTPPSHIREPENEMFLHRKLLYDFVDDANLFEIIYTPPSYSKANIQSVREAFKEICPKRWLRKLVDFGLGQSKAIIKFSNPPTKEEVLTFVRLRSANCQNLPFCVPLMKLTTEMLGGPVKVHHPEWHRACPMWWQCQKKSGCAYELGKIDGELTEKMETLSKLSPGCKEKIKRFKDFGWQDELAELEQQVEDWSD
jgi:hypothetical protein